MEFKRNAKVMTFDGKDVGRVDRVVIDPRSKEVSHLVIRQGFLFTEDKVVPIDLVGAADAESLTLRADAENLENLPKFEETYYVRLDEEDWPEPMRRDRVNAMQPLLWYPPPVGGPGAIYPMVANDPYVAHTEQNIPEGTVALKQGAKVVTADDKQVGVVDEVLTDPQADRATHLIISQGLLIKEKKQVPVSWISSVDEDEIQLAVVSRTVDRLREYADNHRTVGERLHSS